MSSIYLAQNLVFHARTKYIEVHYYFIREHVHAEEIDLQHISTHLQVADIFTKALGVDKLEQFALDLGVMTLTLSLWCVGDAFYIALCAWFPAIPL